MKTEDKFKLLQNIVAEHYMISVSEMMRDTRLRHLCWPRQVLFSMCRELTGAPYETIADAHGFSHATVMHSCKKVRNECKLYSSVRENVVSVRNKCRRALSPSGKGKSDFNLKKLQLFKAIRLAPNEEVIMNEVINIL